MKIVIAGGSGFLGRALSERLVADGHQVLVLTRGGGSRPALGGPAVDSRPGPRTARPATGRPRSRARTPS